MNKVELNNITVRYGEHTVLNNFSLNVESGQIIGIVGPSGCGKTTIVRTICGFLDPQQGTVKINDEIVYDKAKRINVAPEKRNIGVVFQDYAVWPHLSVYDNVAYPLKKHKFSKEDIEKEVNEALRQVNMTSYAKYMPSQLSGGQQQRVAIARALTCTKDFLIMDEPITNLDAKLREQMLIEIRMLQHRLGTTIIYITHDQEAAMQLCDKIIILDKNGNIAQIGNDEEIITNPANRYVFSFVGVSNFIPVCINNGNLCLRDNPSIIIEENKPVGYPDTDKEIEMGVRPMDIIFDESSQLKVDITQSVFLGNIYNYFINLDGKEYRVQRISSGNEEDQKYVEGSSTGIRFVNTKFFEKGE